MSVFPLVLAALAPTAAINALSRGAFESGCDFALTEAAAKALHVNLVKF